MAAPRTWAHTRLDRLLGLALALAVASSPGRALASWEWGGEASLETAYHSNVFNLDASGKNRVESQPAPSVANGRVNEMESVDDFVLSPRLELQGRREMARGELRLTPWFDYDHFVENEERSHPELGLELRYDATNQSQFRIAASYQPEVFKKNYLRRTTALGEVTAAQRVYSPAEYDEFEVSAAYGWRLWRRDQGRLLTRLLDRGDARIRFGYAERSFEDFSNRDLDRLSLGVSVEARLLRNHRVLLDYRATLVDAPGGAETLILDEPSAGFDLNGDFDAVDPNVALITDVDRSRLEQRVELRWTWQLSRGVRLRLGGAYRKLDYDSDGALDLPHNGREDGEYHASVGLRLKTRGGWALHLDGEYSRRRTNASAGLLDDEGGDKRQGVVTLKLVRAL